MVYILARKASHKINIKAPANKKVQADFIIYLGLLNIGKVARFKSSKVVTTY